MGEGFTLHTNNLHKIFVGLILSITILNSGRCSTTSLILSYQKNGIVHFQFQSAVDTQKSLVDLPIVSIALFTEEIKKSGWAVLSIASSEHFKDVYQAYWSGFLETNTSYDLTRAHWMNTLADLCKPPLSDECQTLQNFLSLNLQNTIVNAIRFGNVDEFWYQILLQMWQLKGISDAYKNVFVDNATVLTAEYLLTLKDDVLSIYLLQLSGDLPEIIKALSLEKLRLALNTFGTSIASSPTCSALIKLLPHDVYLSHVTWSPYHQMLRVLKHYNFPWKTKAHGGKVNPGKAISFSSYPSVISSVDDFYITSSKLVALETTIGNSNTALWHLVRDKVNTLVLEPFRVMTANRLARTGNQWVSYFKRMNSGTYNNQWMVFDAKLYSPDKPLPKKGLLTVAEQLPGIVFSADVTDVLTSQTYWASYNIPYFPMIYNMSGFADKAAQYGDVYDYKKTARAQIFLRDHATVHDMASMHKLMRYNNFKEDALSRCNCTPPYSAQFGISSRSDLNDPSGKYPLELLGYRLHGGTDVKITNLSMLTSLNMLATSGPTYDNLPPFDWSNLPIPVPKPLLHPRVWMFEPMLTNFTDYVDGLHNAAAFKPPALIPAY